MVARCRADKGRRAPGWIARDAIAGFRCRGPDDSRAGLHNGNFRRLHPERAGGGVCGNRRCFHACLCVRCAQWAARASTAPFPSCRRVSRSAPFVVSNRTCNPVARIFQQTFEPHLCYSLHRPKKRFPIIFCRGAVPEGQVAVAIPMCGGGAVAVRRRTDSLGRMSFAPAC